MEDAAKTGARRLVTCCPFCIHNLKSAQEIQGTREDLHDDNMDILDLSQFLLLGLKKEVGQ